jgi:DNA repair protein RecN (Recombination protein N)
MLRGLAIRDIVLIDRLDLDFHRGLNVMTGETGAGKSILLDALGLALGKRGRADLIRDGAAQGGVTAVFALTPDSPAGAVLAEAGLEAESEVIVRRVLTPDGRGKAFVNDQRVGVDVLRALGAALVEVHGQHDDRGLLNPAGHRALLDAFAGCEVERRAVAEAWRAVSEAEAALAEERAASEAAARDEEYLRHAVAELDALAPEPGEDASLDAERRRLRAAERLGGELAAAVHALGPGGVEGMLGDVSRRLDGAAPEAEGILDPALDALGRVLAELSEAQASLDAAVEAMAFDPYQLERAEERLFALRGAARKHRVDPDDLPAFAEDLRARLSVVDDGAARLGTLERALAEARARHAEACVALGERRAAAARDLDAAMARELPPLRLDQATFQTAVTPQEPGSEGGEAVSFTVSTNPGTPLGPIERIASGGELSRFLLALKVCLAARNDGLTMIFDEIDRGVGGATADAIGRRLARLAEDAQVIVVTHSPQVAARGRHHWRIVKRQEGQENRTVVSELDAAGRRAEIARMLAGENVTEAAQSAADALLAG